MSIEFDVKLEVKDMYRFSMYHTYTGFQGIFSIVIAIVAFAFAVLTYGQVTATYTFIYAMFGVVFLLYMPCTIYTNAKRQFLMSDVLKQSLHYNMNEKGIISSQGEEKAELLWEQVYKIVETKKNLLIYSNRRNAFIIPKVIIEDQYEQMRELMREHVESYRLRLKK